MVQASRSGRGWAAGSNSFWAGGDGNGYVWASDGASGCSYASDGGCHLLNEALRSMP